MNKEIELKIIYSLKLMQYLSQNGLEYEDVIQHPYKKGFKAWIYRDTEKLRQLMKKFTEGE